MSVYRVLVRHGLVSRILAGGRGVVLRRWERDAPMALWQMDIIGGVFLADGTEAKVMTGVDDHSRYCVICQVVARATGRAVCLAFAGALRRFGVPAEVLTDNGKQFTDRFGNGGEALFDRICRDNGITHLLTPPRHPTTTGKIERFHGSLRREMLNDASRLLAWPRRRPPWTRGRPNTTPPGRIRDRDGMPRRTGSALPPPRAEEDLLPLRVPAVIALARRPRPGRRAQASRPGARERQPGPPYRGGPVEFGGGPGQREHGGPRQAVLAGNRSGPG